MIFKSFRGLVIAGSLFIFQIPLLQTDTVEYSSVHSAIVSIIDRETNLAKDVVIGLADTIEYVSETFKLHPALILAVIHTESRFNPKADAGFGTGLMQIVGSVHKKTKKVLLDPHKNIMIGSRILATYKSMSRSEAEMLQRYNGSYGVTDAYSRKVLTTKKKYVAEFNLHKA